MTDNFYAYMYGQDGNSEKSVRDEKPADTVVMDEGIGEWTHKYVVYCKNPSREFEEEIKSKDGVVAVFMKEKESSPVPAEANPPVVQ